MEKNKEVLLYHVLIDKNDRISNFSEVLRKISDMDWSERIFDFSGLNIIISAIKKEKYWYILLQTLRADELPKIANSKDGGGEEELFIPEGKALSYKNAYIYDPEKNVLGGVKLPNCPQIGKMRYCIDKIVRNENDKIKISFPFIYNRGLSEVLKNAQIITTATFNSLDFYGENISEKEMEIFGRYIGGTNFTQTTKIKGKRGDNIKKVVQPIIDEFLSNDESELPVNVKMTIDGKEIDFQKYYKKYPIIVKMDACNKKYVDYVDLTSKIKEVIDAYEVEIEK